MHRLTIKKKPHIRGVTLVYFPYVVLADEDQQNDCSSTSHCKIPVKAANGSTLYWEWRCCSGAVIEIFQKVAQLLDFTYELYAVEDGYFGTLINGTWLGMVNELIQNRADIAVHALVPLEVRAKYIDFTTEMMTTHYVILTRRTQKTKTLNWKFVEFVEPSLAIAFVVCAVAEYIVISILENVHSVMFQKKRFPLLEVMIYLGGLAFQRDLGAKNPVHWSARVPGLTFAISMSILMTTYTAYITATQIDHNDGSDFRGLKDIKV